MSTNDVIISNYQKVIMDPVADIDMSFYANNIEVAKKIIAILEKELSKQSIAEKDGDMIEQQNRTEIRNHSFESLSKSNVKCNEVSNGTIVDNGNGNGKTVHIKRSIRELLVSGMENLLIEGKIVSITEPQSVITPYGPALVADAMLLDTTGRIKLSLWDDLINMVKQGNNITIENGYTRDYRDEIVLDISKSRGKIYVNE